MKLFKMAGLEPGYQREDLWALIHKYPVAKKTWEEGIEIPGYSSVISKVYRDGLARYILKTEGDDYCRFHFHFDTESVWDTVGGPILPGLSWDCFRDRKVLIREENESGASVSILDSEVLPSTGEGAPIRMQVTGYPLSLKIMEDEYGEGYMLREPTEEGLTDFRYLAPGEIWSVGISYHLVYDADLRRSLRTILRHAPKMMDNLMYAPITRIEHPGLPGDVPVVYVNTFYGELGLILSNLENWESASELQPGKYLYGRIRLQGIAGIDDRAAGIRRSEEENLLIMKSVMTSSSASSSYLLLPFVADDVVFNSQVGEYVCHGIRETLEKLKYNMDANSHLHMDITLAVVVHTAPFVEYPCEPGTKCLAVANRGERADVVVFLEEDEEHRICAIHTMNMLGYVVRPAATWNLWEEEVRSFFRRVDEKEE